MSDTIRVVRSQPVGPVTVRVQREGGTARVIRPAAVPPAVRVSRQGPPGAPGTPGLPGQDANDDPPVDLEILFDNALV